MMYCDDLKAMKYPIRWSEELLNTAGTDAEKKRYAASRASLLEKEKNFDKEKLNWTDMN
jgi:hypothetical protein